mmetsp:Transcript_14359/g.40030  ORF Transcript_14359/g.40030 Transcript_14359/m.40030 type:complete len:84 (-) Transcript_14359:25-276(-)
MHPNRECSNERSLRTLEGVAHADCFHPACLATIPWQSVSFVELQRKESKQQFSNPGGYQKQKIDTSKDCSTCTYTYHEITKQL